MKRLSQVISAVALTMALFVPAMAAEGAAGVHDQNCKKECAIQVKNCQTEVDSLPQRIQRLQTAIEKNADSYSKEELNNLKRQLEEALSMLENLQRGGA